MTKNKDSTKKIFSHKIQQTCQIWPIWCFLESCAGKSKYFHNLFVKKISTFVATPIILIFSISLQVNASTSLLSLKLVFFFICYQHLWSVLRLYIYFDRKSLLKNPAKMKCRCCFFSWTPGSRWNYVVANAWNSFIGVELILTVKNRQSESVDLLRHNVENVKRWKIKWNRKGWLQLETNKPKSIELCENL